MGEVIYHTADGRSREVVVGAGTTLMRAALENAVPGIIGECGGQAMCATCHVYVRPGSEHLLTPMSEDEDEMLDDAAAPRTDRSRLGCQLTVSEVGTIEVDVPGRG